MASQWHYRKGNQKYGPVSSGELKRLAETGAIEPDDLIMKQGMNGWVEAGTVNGLFESRPVNAPETQLPSPMGEAPAPVAPQVAPSGVGTSRRPFMDDASRRLVLFVIPIAFVASLWQAYSKDSHAYRQHIAVVEKLKSDVSHKGNLLEMELSSFHSKFPKPGKEVLLNLASNEVAEANARLIEQMRNAPGRYARLVKAIQVWTYIVLACCAALVASLFLYNGVTLYRKRFADRMSDSQACGVVAGNAFDDRLPFFLAVLYSSSCLIGLVGFVLALTFVGFVGALIVLVICAYIVRLAHLQLRRNCARPK